MLTSMDFSGLLKTLGIGAVPQGFRSSFRDWVTEHTDAPHAVMGGRACARRARQGGGRPTPARTSSSARRVRMEQWAEFLPGR